MMTEANKRGRLYGVGVGPGDPELLTLKGLRLIREADAIAYPVNQNGDGFARDIVAHHMSGDAEEIPIFIPMTPGRSPAQHVYDEAAQTIGAKLEDGLNIVFLCEGDPFFYGSFMYLFARLKDSHDVCAVPGVSSLTACAASLGRPIAARDDILTVLPATLPEATLLERLKVNQSSAIIKVGKHFEKVRRVLDQLDLTDKAGIIEAATTGEERILSMADIPIGERPYFSTILVYQGSESW